jgi:hypothetical protein
MGEFSAGCAGFIGLARITSIPAGEANAPRRSAPLLVDLDQALDKSERPDPFPGPAV